MHAKKKSWSLYLLQVTEKSCLDSVPANLRGAIKTCYAAYSHEYGHVSLASKAFAWTDLYHLPQDVCPKCVVLFAGMNFVINQNG